MSPKARTKNPMRDRFSRLTLLAGLIVMLAVGTTLMQTVAAASQSTTIFKRVPLQFIAALGDPEASSGSGAESWGIWRKDPGPRGVKLKDYEKLAAAGGVAPAKWAFDKNDWWVEENGLIMEQPEFPLPPGKYMVTGDREAIAMLTIHADDENGVRRWELGNDANLYDVTHLGCRSARYTPADGINSCSPAKADRGEYPIRPGAIMPIVEGCKKLDYTVLFIVAVAVDN